MARPMSNVDVLSAQLSAVLTELDAAIYTRFMRATPRSPVRRVPVAPPPVPTPPVVPSPVAVSRVDRSGVESSPVASWPVEPSAGAPSFLEPSPVAPSATPASPEIESSLAGASLTESPFKEPPPRKSRREPEATPQRNRLVETLVAALERIVESMGRARRPLAKRSRLPRHRVRRR